MVKRLHLAAGLLLCAAAASAQGLLPGYNNAFYGDVQTAAATLAQPFLLRQGYQTLAGVVAVDSTLQYAGVSYGVHQVYQNGGASYTVVASQYPAYGISPSVKAVWPYGMPNIAYRPDSTAWWGTGDCVSYVVRVLGATGDTTATGNAYLNLIRTVKAANTTPIAAKGYYATAYQLGAAFPTLGAGDPAGWQYIAGGIVADSIDATNQAIRPTLGTYNGVAKGGFANARGGDVLAWSFPRSASFNGHLMILDGTPQRLLLDSLQAYLPAQSAANLNALLARYRVYAASLFDCSGKKAHFRDSRQTVSGGGHGTVLVLARLSDDVPQGFLFSPGAAGSSGIRPDTLGPQLFALSVGRWKGGTATPPPGGLGMQPAPEMTGWVVAPNPATDELRVTGAERGTLLLLDASGRVLRQEAVSAGVPAAVSLTGLAAGVYWIRCQSAGGVAVRQVEKR